MKFITIAYGVFYRELALKGFVNSFIEYNSPEDLILYVDVEPMWDIPKSITVVQLDSEDISDINSISTSFFDRTKIKFKYLKHTAKYYNTGVCWLDCDSLILDDLKKNIDPKQINVMKHGSCPDTELFDCGDGLKVLGKDFAVGGVFYLPSELDADYLVSLVLKRESWDPDPDAYWYNDGEQSLLNHLIYRTDRQFCWLDKYNNIYNWAFLERRHPVPYDKGLRAIEFSGHSLFTKSGAKISVLSWSSLTLRRHIKQGFLTLGLKKSTKFRRYYQLDQTPKTLLLYILYSIYDFYYIKIMKKI